MKSASAELPVLQCAGSKLVKFPIIEDARGVLSFGQVGDQLPFTPVRFFTISDVKPGAKRGEHAHRELQQLFLCVRGAVRMTIQDGHDTDELTLDNQSIGLYTPPKTWVIMEDFTADAFVFVLTSDVYKESDYIRKRDEFDTLTAGR